VGAAGLRASRTVILDELVLATLLQELLVGVLVDIVVDVALLFDLRAGAGLADGAAAAAGWLGGRRTWNCSERLRPSCLSALS
tara:strand:- start:280 stop:528 length:249 start_codon:yes stop_codon:yes gene_type:complete